MSDAPHEGADRGQPGPERKHGRLWLIAAAVAAMLIAVVIVRLHHADRRAMRGGAFHGANAPVPVAVATVSRGDVPLRIPALGAITPLATVTVRTQISGELQTIAFTEGQMVHAGQFLAQIDPRPYQAALEEAQAALDRDAALLANARLDLRRYTGLIARHAIAEQQLDTQRALVAQYVGTVEGDRAQVRAAALNLTYAHIVAPIAGRVGLRQIDAGNYVTPGDANGIVVITQLRPISAIFSIPEDDIDGVLRAMRSGKTLEVDAYDRSDSAQLASGKLLTIDNQIDPTTGTVKLRAQFANDGGLLFPNQFVIISLLETVLHGRVLIPGDAVHRGAPNGVASTFVYLVGAARKVAVRPVVLGPASGDLVVVKRGLEPGQRVVTEGGDRLRDGATVQWSGADR
ncbi:MAG TPA: efflux RND transporter periplasmic adaptor subunit [Steroidobacteraceae bacterium]|nr:efflux RND transporter periplasmic adaptor subunit [Steroidobacteraceae bacterium]